MGKQTGSQLASIGAVLISVAALAIGIVQAQIMNEQQKIMAEQQKASVWPYVNVEKKIKSTPTGSKVEIFLENKGVGPAIVSNMNLQYKGGRYEDVFSFLDALTDAEIEASSGFKFNISSGRKTVLKPSEKQLVFEINADSLTREQKRDLSGIQIALCYCSVHGDCWGGNGRELGDENTCGALN